MALLHRAAINEKATTHYFIFKVKVHDLLKCPTSNGFAAVIPTSTFS